MILQYETIYEMNIGNLEQAPVIFNVFMDRKSTQNCVPGPAINLGARHVEATCLDFTRVLPRLVNVSLFVVVFFW